MVLKNGSLNHGQQVRVMSSGLMIDNCTIQSKRIFTRFQITKLLQPALFEQ